MSTKKLPKAIRTTAAEMRDAGAGIAAPDLKVVPGSAEEAPPGPAAAEAAVHAIVPVAPDAAQRLAWARDIVQRHAAYSVVGGIVPLPIVNFASVATINVRMVKLLSTLYGVPFERNRARAMVIGLMGGILPTGIRELTTSTLLSILPGANLIGLAVSSVTAAACTRGIGRIFVDHFESGATTFVLPAIATR
jgi:uncharacterized protein (DUF697 family)